MTDIFNFFEKPKDPLSFSAIRISLASPGEDPRVVARRGEEAGDDQLPHVQAGARRPLLREDLRPGEGLRVQLRQVQAHEAPRHRLREVRRRGHPVQGAPRAPRPHHPGHAGRAHLVPEEPAVAHRQPARHHAARTSRRSSTARRTSSSTRSETGLRTRRAPHRGALPRAASTELRRRRVRRRHGRRGRSSTCSSAIDVHVARRAAARRDARGDQRGQAQEARQAPQGRRGVPRVAATSPSG